MDEMQGVMALPEAQGAGMRPEDMAIFEQIRRTIPRQEITKEFLAAGEQADPQAVAEFKQELAGLELTPDELNKLNTMVDAILAAPQDYASLRRAYLAEGMPEDLLPEQFDPAFFAALNMAIDTIAMNPGSPPPMAMAMGGVADLAAYGRNGDTMLAHITPQEAAMLKRMGGSGTINPYTGLPEYASIFKKIGNAVKKFAKSTVGKVLIGAALFAFAGPAAAGFLSGAAGSVGLTGVSGFLASKVGIAAVSGFVAGAGSTLAAGGNLKQALKAGAVGGITAGAMSGISGAIQGTNNFAAPSPLPGTPPPGIAAPIDNLTAPPLDRALPTGGAPADLVSEAARGNIPPMNLADPSQAEVLTYRGSGMPPTSQGIQVASTAFPPVVPVEATVPSGIETLAQSPAATPPGGPLDMTNPMNRPYYDATMAGEAAPIVDRSTVMQPPRAGILENLSKGNFREAANQFMPKGLGGGRGVVTPEMIQTAMPDAEKLITALRPDLSYGSPEFSRLASAQALKMATPSMLSTYGPLAALGIGALGLSGGFKTKDAQMPDLFKGLTGFQLARMYPSMYGLQYGGVRPTAYGGMYLTPPGYAEGGGVMDTPQAMRVGGKTYPRKIGAINGPGTGTSDSIPAMLSDGEFVFTAKAVRAMGNGSRRKGAKKMYKLMKMLEGKAA